MTDPATAATASVALSPWHPAALIATAGGIGYLPKAPGSWASLAALPLAWLIDVSAGRGGILVAGVVIACVGIWAGQVYVDRHRAEDPGEVVVDEVAAQLLVLAALPLSLFSSIAGFALFRLFDIWKPWPVSWADRHVKGGLGIMLDDLLAAAYAALVLIAIIWLKDAVLDVP